MSSNTFCPACNETNTRKFYTASNVPSNACLLFDDQKDALDCPRGDIELYVCATCGFIFNAAFDAAISEYSDRYEATQGFSPTFSGFQKRLGEQLITRHKLDGKTVMEIGCGHGEFLLLLSQLGECTGIGIDPSADPGRISDHSGAERVTLLKELFQDKHAAIPTDLIVCKMTLEHIPNIRSFLGQIRRNLEGQADTTVFIQVPESLSILRNAAFEDIYYEHCSYFTPGSLARTFRESGFDVELIDTQYDGQYLVIEGKPAQSIPGEVFSIENDLSDILSYTSNFQRQIDEAVKTWRSRIGQYSMAEKSIVLWGSGAKAVAFLSCVNMNMAIHHVVDINPHKSGSFMPVSGQPIVLPEDLVEVDPDLVIIMNPIYEKEITNNLRALGLTPDIVCA